MEKDIKIRKEGITLIALVITIIVLLILAGIAISLTLGQDGILKQAEEAGIRNSEATAKEELELALLDLQTDKVTKIEYNENEYIDNYLTSKQMIVMGDIVIVDGWQFKIDRSVPKIIEILGNQEIDFGITQLTLDKEEMIIVLTYQNIEVPNKDQIKVTTENISKEQYKWEIEDTSIASIDENGNVTAIESGNTVIKCTSIDGRKVYATCNLIVEQRDYLYYKGNSLVEFESPIHGAHGTLKGSPYFREAYIYTNFSNVGYKNETQYLNIVTKDKIDFSKYKGVGIESKIEYTGAGAGSHFGAIQEKTCNSYGLISYEERWTAAKKRGENGKYFDITNYKGEAYLNTIINVGEYLSGLETQADTHIYEIYLVRRDDKILDLDKEEIVIGLTEQEGIEVSNKDQIKVTTENISKEQYKWEIEDTSIANIDENGNITASKSGNTVIKCTSIDGRKVYATCNLIVEQRDYLYYKGNSLVEFESPIHGAHGTLKGSPYFRETYIYTNFSNVGYKNESQLLNIITKDKIDFSKYKGVGIESKIEYTGAGAGSHFGAIQEKTCNLYGLIPYEASWTAAKKRGENGKYFDITNYKGEAYLDIIIGVGKYQSGVETTADMYIYEIYLVK